MSVGDISGFARIGVEIAGPSFLDLLDHAAPPTGAGGILATRQNQFQPIVSHPVEQTAGLAASLLAWRYFGVGGAFSRASSTPPSDSHVGAPGVGGSSTMVTFLTCTSAAPPEWTWGAMTPSRATSGFFSV